MKYFTFFLFVFALSIYANTSVNADANSNVNTEQKIKQNEKQLSKRDKSKQQLTMQLNQVAEKILLDQQDINNAQKTIEELDHLLGLRQADAEQKEKDMQMLKDSTKAIQQTKNALESKMIEMIASEFSFSVILENNDMSKIEDFMSIFVLNGLKNITNRNFLEMKETYRKTVAEIAAYKKEMDEIVEFMRDLKKKKEILAKLKESKAKELQILEKKKQEYMSEIEKIQNEQQEIFEALKSLKILKEEEEKEREARAKELEKDRLEALKKSAAAKQESLSSKQGLSPKEDAVDVNVRQIGTSYQKSSVLTYQGEKTIAPLDDFVVVRKFGSYVDPVYNIKIFNESVTLRSKIKDAVVKNILNGKVIFAKETTLLDNVVIIENENGIHTIYAKLSKIAPTIKPGVKIKKGYVVGRIEEELKFEVTQKNFHIDPLELIHLR